MVDLHEPLVDLSSMVNVIHNGGIGEQWLILALTFDDQSMVRDGE